MSQQAGKAVSKWTATIGGKAVGGQPPTFDDIETEVDDLKRFTNVLFEDDTSDRWNPKVRELLVMALLLRYEQFCDVVRSHPEATVAVAVDVDADFDANTSSLRDHLFLCRVNQALEKARVCKDMFGNWIVEARRAFLSRNIPGIPIGKFSLYDGGKDGNPILMDPRCFVDHFNALALVTQSIHMDLQHQKHMLNDIRKSLGTERAINNDYIIGKIYNMDKSIRRLENHLMGEAKPTATTLSSSSSGVIRFSVSSKGLTNQMSVADVTVAFFFDNHPVGWKLDKESDSWSDVDISERKRLRNHFSAIKRAVRMVLMHADSYPSIPNDPLQYKESIRRIATAAEERIRNDLCFGNRIITIYKLNGHSEMKNLEKSLKLPENTPEEACKFFKSDT